MAKYRANASEPWRVLKIKALDSMPVGTIVDYDGTSANVPVGWETLGNDYSTTEINTGKTWIDGKPIYRLVIEITDTNSTTNWRQYDYSTLGIPSGIEMARVPEAYSIIIQENNPYVESFYSQGTRIQTSPATAKVNILGNGTAYNRYIIIMEYTKTTD